eukprot:NODE_48_length_31852_cov_1.054168.p21 type:complete len:149 gc:universal NODE_48_length_31852_cov_1.054168:21613-22059(+)
MFFSLLSIHSYNPGNSYNQQRSPGYSYSASPGEYSYSGQQSYFSSGNKYGRARPSTSGYVGYNSNPSYLNPPRFDTPKGFENVEPTKTVNKPDATSNDSEPFEDDSSVETESSETETEIVFIKKATKGKNSGASIYSFCGAILISFFL